jgi:hypothetical protein
VQARLARIQADHAAEIADRRLTLEGIGTMIMAEQPGLAAARREAVPGDRGVLGWRLVELAVQDTERGGARRSSD